MTGKPEYQLEDLLYLMARLRDPQDGCPWDLKQSYQTILPHTLEEVYEVADAIERSDINNLREELGDLLFQIVFYAQLGKEDGSFDFSGIIDGIVNKLVRRHPHVFPDGSLQSRRLPGQEISEQDIKANWQKIKQAEKQAQRDEEASVVEQSKPDSILSSVPLAAPALARAEKLQKAASHHGFDWPDIEPVFEKIEEELAELKAELSLNADNPALRQTRLEEELGDVIFSCVNLARFLKVSPEMALRGANSRFQSRFSYIEAQLRTQQRSVAATSLDELDALWRQAKRNETSA
ncbi:MAG: nucleoside triphosphate pyrophosphohydrolase [Hahellaceae bacterium]|nr:nucleoside triphosphate pyrophosphohydrolase [Hahellaceae bacterium]